MSITPDDILNEVEGLTKDSWFNPVDPFKAHVQPLEFIVDGFCAKGMITIIGASPGAGKSILVQYLFSKHNNNLLKVKAGAERIKPVPYLDNQSLEAYNQGEKMAILFRTLKSGINTFSLVFSALESDFEPFDVDSFNAGFFANLNPVDSDIEILKKHLKPLEILP